MVAYRAMDHDDSGWRSYGGQAAPAPHVIVDACIPRDMRLAVGQRHTLPSHRVDTELFDFDRVDSTWTPSITFTVRGQPTFSETGDVARETRTTRRQDSGSASGYDVRGGAGGGGGMRSGGSAEGTLPVRRVPVRGRAEGGQAVQAQGGAGAAANGSRAQSDSTTREQTDRTRARSGVLEWSQVTASVTFAITGNQSLTLRRMTEDVGNVTQDHTIPPSRCREAVPFREGGSNPDAAATGSAPGAAPVPSQGAAPADS